MLTHVDLFSGIGGFALAAEWAGFKTIIFCEKDEYCQKILKKYWPEVPIIEDIRDFKWSLTDSKHNGLDETKNRGGIRKKSQKRRMCKSSGKNSITLLTGGFPCQPFSVAGKRRGKEDDRYLWPDMFRVISEVRPTWVLAENVAGIVKMELDNCLSDLEGEGYETETFIIPACAVGTPHRRDRVWIIANSSRAGIRNQKREISDEERSTSKNRGKSIRQRNWKIGSGGIVATDRNDSYSKCLGREKGARKGIQSQEQITKGQDAGDFRTEREDVAYGKSTGLEGREEGLQPRIRNRPKRCSQDVADSEGILPQGYECRQEQGKSWRKSRWPVEPNVGRVAHGIPSRVDRLKALGNAIVPQVAYEIMRVIAMIEKEASDE